MSAHTPGPWVATFEDYRWVIDCQGDFGPRKALAVTAGHYPKHEANARLISAAPDLLEALEEALQTAEFEKHPERPWHAKARAARSKAKGQ